MLTLPLKSLSTVLIGAFLTFTLSTGLAHLTRQNTAVAQNNITVQTKCTDKDTLALYKTIGELNTRVSIGINYIDFTKYYTDLVIRLNSLETVSKCPELLKQFEVIRENYNIARLLWKRSFRQRFMSLDHFIVKDALAYQPDLKQYDNYVNDVKTVATEDLVRVFMAIASDEYNKINF